LDACGWEKELSVASEEKHGSEELLGGSASASGWEAPARWICLWMAARGRRGGLRGAGAGGDAGTEAAWDAGTEAA